MNTTEHTVNYEELLNLTREAEIIMGHPSSSDRFTSETVADLTREVISLISRFLSASGVRDYDHELLTWERDPKTNEFAPFTRRWLKESGSEQLKASIKSFVDNTYGSARFSIHDVRRLRSSFALILQDSMNYLIDSPIPAADASAAAQQAKEALSDLHFRELQHMLESAEAGVASIEEKEKIAEKTVESIGDAAGQASDLELAKHYDVLATKESRAANWFRGLTVGMVVAATGATWAFIAGPAAGWEWLSIAPGDYVHLIQRGVFVGAVFALGGYFARQAHQHRSMGNWSRSLAVQLKTFDAYVAAIVDSEVKDELRKSFAARVFGDHPAMRGEPTITPSAAALDTAVNLVAKLSQPGK